jgi:hypothetical protein
MRKEALIEAPRPKIDHDVHLPRCALFCIATGTKYVLDKSSRTIYQRLKIFHFRIFSKCLLIMEMLVISSHARENYPHSPSEALY